MEEYTSIELMDRLFEEEDAARILACSEALLRKWRRLGAGPRYCKIGRLVRYAESDLQAFIEDCRKEVA